MLAAVKRRLWVIGLVSMTGVMTPIARAQSSGSGAGAPSRPPLVDVPFADDILYGYFDTKKQLADNYGTKIGLNIDLLDQSQLAGPGPDNSYFVVRYDFGVHQQLWKGAEADMDLRGGTGGGPDVQHHNTVNTNQYAQTGSDAFILHLWVQQKLFDDQLTLRGGKMDVGDFMDVNRFGYYNFVGYSFAHNFSIPLPGNPLAGMFTFDPAQAKWAYFSGAIANGAQSSYRPGFKELADGDEALFALGELGFKTKFFGQEGVYRFEGWYDGRDLSSIDGTTKSDDDRAGWAISFDQNVTKKFGLFARYGYGNQHDFNPQQYWSAGFDWFGPIPGRAKDDFAIGLVQNIFSKQRDAVVGNATHSETYLEAYYNLQVTDWMQIQPIFQVVDHPGGLHDSTEFVAGVHVGLRF